MIIRSNDGAVSIFLMIVVIIVVAILASTFILVPYLTRADDYANPPDGPPDEVEDESPPNWQCRFNIEVKCTVPLVGWTDIEIKDMSTTLEEYDGDPFDMGGWPTFLFTKPESVTVNYELSFTKGSIKVPPDGPDKGSFKVYKDDDYKGSGKTHWFFWWNELEGNWEYTLKVKYGDQIDVVTGVFGYFVDGRSVVN